MVIFVAVSAIPWREWAYIQKGTCAPLEESSYDPAAVMAVRSDGDSPSPVGHGPSMTPYQEGTTMTRTSTRTPTNLLPRYATLPEAIEYCRSSRRSLERRIAEGKLTRFQNGFRVLVDLNEIDAMLRGERH